MALSTFAAGIPGYVKRLETGWASSVLQAPGTAAAAGSALGERQAELPALSSRSGSLGFTAGGRESGELCYRATACALSALTGAS